MTHQSIINFANKPKKKDLPITPAGKVWEFTFVTTPKGQPRQQHFVVKGADGYKSAAFTPDVADAFKFDIKAAAINAGLKNLLIKAPIRLSITYRMPRPDSHFNTKGELKKEHNTVDHIGKPDMDNIIKATKDALSDIWVWSDDAMVSRYGEMLKIYAPPQTAAETTIRIETLPW
jgi:Holliday junction resolvase RusA-like endonuclease